ncbi:MAG: methylated-DNA--[protein]-cysteine S-methyltransferase [Candidatus Verstraetearchaeota archaeon]|nr:methylated-DNA--[protein]-cysteine S-methyltransferase [Candidatus Verstraetearchaeota archaeon]
MSSGARGVSVVSFRIQEGWVAFAVDGLGRVFANSIPCPERRASVSSVIRSLERRGISEISIGDVPDQRGRIEELPSVLSGGGGRAELAFDGFSVLQATIMKAVMGIPRGYVASYGDVASAIGKPSLARAVGAAMSRNPFPLVVPCHRVVRSDMSLGGFSYGVDLKERLLEREGVEVTGGKVRERHRLARDKLSCRSLRCP